MKEINRKLVALAAKMGREEPIRIAILGLGSVGNYLLDYLLSWDEQAVEIHVGGRNEERILRDINIVRVGNGIRFKQYKKVVFHHVDLDNPDQLQAFFRDANPDVVVNTSRVYSGLKYGSISWHTVRAYGIWTPLAVRYIKNITEANRDAQAIIINTSYSDGVNPWLKSAGGPYPDFGSGNLNHLIPRITLAAVELLKIDDPRRIDVVLACSHFHDVVISKEGHDEGVAPLLAVLVDGEQVDLDHAEIYRRCAIEMPVDAKRNIMNASSNFEIISKIVGAIRRRSRHVFHSPGVNGELGGFPVYVDFTVSNTGDHIGFVEDWFTLEEMRSLNAASLALDGIEGVQDGRLRYTDDLLEKIKDAFGVTLPKHVDLADASEVGEFIIERIIEPQLKEQ